MNLSFVPKNKEVQEVFERITKYPTIRIDPKLAQTISRHKKIRYLREYDYIYIGMDRIKGKSIISLPPSVKVKKNKNGFIFKY